MHAYNRKNNMKNMSNVGGDSGMMSFYSQSSFDASSVMDTSGLGFQQKSKLLTPKAPMPPNDKMIHVSQCKNDKCPLQNIYKHQQYNNNGMVQDNREFDQQFIPFYACPKCDLEKGDQVKYCSQRCFQQDWFKLHQYECSGQQPEARDSVLLSEVNRIESSTPFIKEPIDLSLITPEQQKLEQVLSSITKKDLDFDQSKSANLGKGSYGEVQLAKHRESGMQIAVKKIEKASLSTAKMKETLIREIRIQKQMNHEYICRLYSSFEDKTTIYLSLEFAKKGNLFYLIRKEKYLSEDTAFYFFIQVCSGIYYMHKQGLIHRDIKPENILIKEGNIIKICDFGWCVQSDHSQQRNTFCGTLEYMAPEMIQNKAHNHTLDIWALGILLYELVHGRAPFTGVHPREISDKIMRGVIRFKPGVSAEYKDLVNSILKYETNERIPLIKVFDHPWVRNFEKKYNLTKSPPPSNKQEDDKRAMSQKAAQAKALVEAAMKQKVAEKEAAAKEQRRLEKKKQQQIEQEMLIAKQQALEEAEKNRQRNEENKRKAAIAAAATASSIMEHSTQEDQDYQNSGRKNRNENIDDVQDHYNKMMQELEKKQKEKQQKNKSPKNFNAMAQQRATEDELDIPSFDDEDKTVMMTAPTKGGRSKKDKDKEKKDKKKEDEKQKKDKQKQAILAAAAAIMAEQKKQEEERQKKKKEQSEKETPKPVLIQNNSVNNRSNKKYKNDDVNYENENSMTKKGRLELSMKKKEEPPKQKEDQREKENEILPRTRVSIPYSKDEFDKLEQDFTVLDETEDLKEIEEDHDSVSDVDSDNFRSMQPHQARKDSSPRKKEELKEAQLDTTISPDKHDDSDDLNRSVSNDHETDKYDSELEEESEEEDSYESEVESSSEDEREQRRKAQKHKKLKGMDPLYDSSGAESIKSRRKPNGEHPTDQEFSEDDEEEKSVFGKIGAFLFFGCGGSKDKKQKE